MWCVVLSMECHNVGENNSFGNELNECLDAK